MDFLKLEIDGALVEQRAGQGGQRLQVGWMPSRNRAGPRDGSRSDARQEIVERSLLGGPACVAHVESVGEVVGLDQVIVTGGGGVGLEQ